MAFPTGWTLLGRYYVPSSILTASLSNFPVRLNQYNLNPSVFSYIANGGGDFRVSQDMAGLIRLYADVTIFNTSTLRCLIDFKYPSLSNLVDNYFYLWGKNPGETQPAGDKENTWDSDFVEVHHMQDDPGTSNLLDSTGDTYKEELAPINMDSSNLTDNGIIYNGSNEYHVRVSSSSTFVGNLTAFTLEAYFSMLGNGASMVPFGEGYSVSILPFVCIATADAGGGLTDIQFAVRDNAGGGGVAATIEDQELLNTGFHYVSAIQSAKNNRKIYLNGETSATATTTLGTLTLNRISSGALVRNTVVAYFNGIVGELRKSKIARSYDWQHATWLTLKYPAQFVLEAPMPNIPSHIMQTGIRTPMMVGIR